MRHLYRGQLTEKDEKAPAFTLSLLADNMAEARSRLRGHAASNKLHLLRTEDLGEPPTSPPEARSAEDKLLAAIFGTDQRDYNMPEDYESLQGITR